jgi:hypothetical protein
MRPDSYAVPQAVPQGSGRTRKSVSGLGAIVSLVLVGFVGTVAQLSLKPATAQRKGAEG